MNLDDNQLTTVQATVGKTSGGKPVINLLKPFLPGPVMVRSRISHLKLLSGNEGGISLAIDGNQLTLDLEYYGYLPRGDSEVLYYEYRINLPDRTCSKHTAMMTIMATEESDCPALHEAVLTTDRPFDPSACENLVPTPGLEISPAPPETDKAVAGRSKEIDQAIAETDQLLEATLGIEQHADRSPEKALETLINQIPDKQIHQPEAEAELEHIIEELSAITDKSPAPLTDSTAGPQQQHEVILKSLDSYLFNLEDFDKPFGIPVDKLEKIKLNTLPSSGHILYNRKPADAGLEISRVDLLTGRLTFKPDEHLSDRGHSQFFFSPCYSALYSAEQLFKFSYMEGESEVSGADTKSISPDVTMAIDITTDNGTSVLASGNMTIQGKDSAHFEITAGTLTGTYGALTVNSNGYWTYSLDKNQPAILDLGENNSLSEHFVIPTQQGNEHGISLTIIYRNKQVDILISQEPS